MSKNQDRSNMSVVSKQAQPEQAQAEQVQSQPQPQQTAPAVEVTAAPAVEVQPNHTIVYRRDHPGGGALGRCSYGINGVPGIVVFDKSLFPDGVPPASIDLSCVMVSPRTKVVTAKSELAAVKAAEKATKAAERIAAAAAKAAERQAKADKALADAKARVDAATKAAKASAPVAQ